MKTTARGFGKTTLNNLHIEHSLDDGKTVLIFSQNGITKKKRVKHLTLIEQVEIKKNVTYMMKGSLPTK